MLSHDDVLENSDYDSYDENDAQEFEDGGNLLESTNGSGTKRRRLTDTERLKRRERNRVHARNTRERKKAQLDSLQQR